VFKATFGLSSERTHDVAAKAIARLARFGFVTIRPGTLAVRTRVPRLSRSWLAELPEYLRDVPALVQPS
jgi:hypothetical protein